MRSVVGAVVFLLSFAASIVLAEGDFSFFRFVAPQIAGALIAGYFLRSWWIFPPTLVFVVLLSDHIPLERDASGESASIFFREFLVLPAVTLTFVAGRFMDNLLRRNG